MKYLIILFVAFSGNGFAQQFAGTTEQPKAQRAKLIVKTKFLDKKCEEGSVEIVKDGKTIREHSEVKKGKMKIKNLPRGTYFIVINHPKHKTMYKKDVYLGRVTRIKSSFERLNGVELVPYSEEDDKKKKSS